MSTTTKKIKNVFSAWKSSCEKTKKDQMTMFRKIEKYAAKLNSKERAKFLDDAAMFNEQYELKLSLPFSKLDNLLAHYDQMEWDAKNKKKRSRTSEVGFFFPLYYSKLLSRKRSQNKRSKKRLYWKHRNR